MLGKNYINNHWTEGLGEKFTSINPATGGIVWEGSCSSRRQVNEAVDAARLAFKEWSLFSLENRIGYLEKFCLVLKNKRAELARAISQETGKPLWESDMEVGAMINKLPISIEAYQERCREHQESTSIGSAVTRHMPHGVMGVIGPFNFPGHLPNGHIIPALLAGNTVVFKASELTPWFAEEMIRCWEEAALPSGVLNLIQGDREVGSWLAEDAEIDGLLFTGSLKTGKALAKLYSDRPGKILALEMGGNNPLVVHNVSDLKAAAYHIILSAYMTSGQRCTCARRLILTNGKKEEELLKLLTGMVSRLKVGIYSDNPEPFMGPVISNVAADHVLQAAELLEKAGGVPLVAMRRKTEGLPLLTPGLIDVTFVPERRDEEIFGPLLQVVWVDSFEEAILEANQTSYGLSAGLLCDDEALYLEFRRRVRAGIINWNRPLTGASSKAPFGGIKSSGNHRPSAYYAADYCSYPVASLEEKILHVPQQYPPGIVE